MLRVKPQHAGLFAWFVSLAVGAVLLVTSGCSTPTQQLSDAIDRGDSVRAAELLKDPQSLGGLDRWLTVAASKGQNTIAAQLLGAGAKLDDGEALIAATQAGQEETVKLLLDRGANINKQGTSLVIRDVRYGSNNGQTFASFQLVEIDGTGNNALSTAILSKHVSIIRLLLERGADRTLNVTYRDAGIAEGALPFSDRMFAQSVKMGTTLQITLGGGAFLLVQNGRVFTDLRFEPEKQATIQDLAQMSGDKQIIGLVPATVPSSGEGL